MAKTKTVNEPLRVTDKKIAVTWWGKAWIENLERYADYSNRLPRGKTYVRKGSVVDFHMKGGHIDAKVQGSRPTPYKIEVTIDPLSQKNQKLIEEQCAHKIQNVEALINGDFPEDMRELFMIKGDGLFPSPKEIHFKCSCPDWAFMCKHIASVLYGVGAKLDTNPLLFFEMREMKAEVLLKKSIDEKIASMLSNVDKKTDRTIAMESAMTLFSL
jgi:uncharacterized Zn finger protein